MTTQKLSKANNKLINANFGVIILLCFVIYGLAIFQDYLFSRFKSIGFYWSDTMLYNIYWLLFIPFIKFANNVNSKIQPKTVINKTLYALFFGIVFSVLHIFLFTSIFILGSNIIYSTPHKFSTILKNAISNQSQITIITYLFLPFVIDYLNRKRQDEKDVSIQKIII